MFMFSESLDPEANRENYRLFFVSRDAAATHHSFLHKFIGHERVKRAIILYIIIGMNSSELTQ